MDNLSKKLASNDKMLENINNRMDNFSTAIKNQISFNKIRGTRYPPERKEKENIEHLILLKKLQSARKVCIPSKEQK